MKEKRKKKSGLIVHGWLPLLNKYNERWYGLIFLSFSINTLPSIVPTQKV